MARLQDFQNVTPTANDKFLIVQSAGQGLAPHTIKMDSANPTGTGALSINRKANTTVGLNSVAIGQNCTANGQRAFAEGYETVASNNQAHAEGQSTTASGQASHAEGVSTIANHRSQHVFGEFNVADTSTAAAANRGNYIEIVGKGDSTTPSNARTLDWNGNEVLAGDLKINGTQSLSKLSSCITMSAKSGSIASFSTDVADRLYSCKANIVAKQAGTGTPSPSNPRSITGFSSVNVAVSSKNLWANGDITFTGYNSTAIYFYRPLPPATYTISAIVTSNDTHASTCAAIIYYTDGTTSSVYQFSRGSRTSITTTPSKYLSHIVFYSSDNYSHGAGDTATWADIQFEKSSTMTAYEKPQVHTITLPETIYGGSAELVGGNGTKDHVCIEFDGTENWIEMQSGTASQFYMLSGTDFNYNVVSDENDISSMFERAGIYTTSTYEGFLVYMASGTTPRLNIRPNLTTFPDLASFTTMLANKKLAGTPLQICFKVAPTTFTFTGANISTLLGTNNVYADSSNIDLKYLETIGNKFNS